MKTSTSDIREDLVSAGPPDCTADRVAGFVPTSMLDWPGVVCTTIFVTGCTLRCPYCHNPELLTGDAPPHMWQSALSHIAIRRGWIDGVVISGGEPTTDPGLPRLLEDLATRGLPVKLDTNGTRPDVLGRVLADGLVEYVALDVKTFPERYDLLGLPGAAEMVAESIDIVRDSGVRHEFRTTVFPPIITSDELPRLASPLTGGDAYVLQQFRPARTLDPDAASVTPVPPEALTRAASECSRYLPTTTRGV